jgi:hypothetical protein
MAGNTVNLPQHFQGASPGTAMVGANTRVKGQPGFMGTQTDSLLFADGTGSWVVPNTRTRILGTFMISQSSQGLEATTSGPVPILVVMGDARVRSL